MHPRRLRANPRPPWLLLAFAPLLLAWQGSGKSDGTVETSTPDRPPETARTAIDAVARIEAGSTQIVLVLVLPGERDAVMTLEVRADWGVNLAVPSPLVDLVYEEYDRDGETQFLTHVATGTVETVFRTSGAVSLALALTFDDAGAGRTVEFSDVAVTLVPDVVAPEEADEAGRAAPAGGSLTATTGGCEDDGYEGSSAEDSAWDGGGSADSSGGCDGDTPEGGSDTSDDSGCEGDDLESSTDSDSEASSDSCDGDAAAAAPPRGSPLGSARRVRAPLVAKLVAWLPYLLVLLPLGLRRLRRRLAVSG